MKAKSKLKEKIGGWAAFAAFTVIGGIAGGLMGVALKDRMLGGVCLSGNLIALGTALLVICAAGFLQIVLHELGHLVFGLLSGYRFVSFRVGSLMLAAEEEGCRFRRYTVAGTGGQCLMLPPPRSADGGYPTVLYNLGGSAFNFLSIALCLLLYPVLPNALFLRIFLWGNAVFGLLMGLSNAIPLKLGGIANDGYNALALRKDPVGLRAFWVQLQVNGLMTRGQDLADMPPQWFVLPGEEALKNPIVGGLANLCAAYHHSRRDFERAEQVSRYLLEHAPGMLELHRNELRCELLFYEIIGPCRRQEIDALYTGALKKYMQATKIYLSRIRLQYAYELLVLRDEKRAQKTLARFHKAAKSWPYRAEVKTEGELMKLIEQKARALPSSEA